MNYFFEGFLLQASLILALGAQNLFVLESGLKRHRHFMVAAICSLCDILLIGVGVMGAASIFLKFPILKNTFGIIGVLFLAYYGFKKITESRRNQSTEGSAQSNPLTTAQTVLLTLGFSLLNPHVYLDTIVLIGGYSSKFFEVTARAQFGAGAGFFSLAWFFGLAYFASSMSALLNQPKTMRSIALISGLILLTLSAKLGADVYHWITG